MVTQTAQSLETPDHPTLLIRSLHGIVIHAPWDLDIVAAMRSFGYNEYKWAEGESLLAELVATDAPNPTTISAAQRWYDEAANTASHAFVGKPVLLAKLGLTGCKGDVN